MSAETEDEAISVEDIIIVAMQRRKKVDDEYVGEEVRDDKLGFPYLSFLCSSRSGAPRKCLDATVLPTKG